MQTEAAGWPAKAQGRTVIRASLFGPDAGGMFNAVLALFGLGNLTARWLGDADTALLCRIVAYYWAQIGLPPIVILAAAQSVPRTTIEAA